MTIKRTRRRKLKKYKSRKNKRTLREINVKILPKQITAIVGPTGSGKSTFVDMLPRLREPDEGRILFDNNILSSLDITSDAELVDPSTLKTILDNYPVISSNYEENKENSEY